MDVLSFDLIRIIADFCDFESLFNLVLTCNSYQQELQTIYKKKYKEIIPQIPLYYSFAKDNNINFYIGNTETKYMGPILHDVGNSLPLSFIFPKDKGLENKCGIFIFLDKNGLLYNINGNCFYMNKDDKIYEIHSNGFTEIRLVGAFGKNYVINIHKSSLFPLCPKNMNYKSKCGNHLSSKKISLTCFINQRDDVS